MGTRFIRPDFRNNIVNISATLAEYLGCPNGKPVLPDLQAELKKGYKNVVFLIFDGLGTYPIGKNLGEGSFFRRHTVRTLTSVFPSTTTNAVTTYLTGRYPMEHGWFGWSLYFEELGRAVDIFADTDSYTREQLEKGTVKKLLPVEPFFRGAKHAETNVVVPPYWDYGEENRFVFSTFEEFFAHIGTICGKEGRQFVYAYCDNPDATMHRYGVTSAEARAVIGLLSESTEALYARVHDTLFVISADHGQTDVTGTVELYRDEELLRLLAWKPYLESRATAFKVQEGCREAFCSLFLRKYGADFELFESARLVEENYFGETAGKNAKLLGDYIAVSKAGKIMRTKDFAHDFKGHHASLTEEMEVPLILAAKR